jgi:hypothetical protein
MTENLVDTAKFKAIQDAFREQARQAAQPPTIVARAKIRLVKDQLKEARVGPFTLLCDEGADRGGSGEHPTPLAYFSASIGF